MISTLTSGVGLFVATNVDDLVVLTLFFLAAQRGAIRTWHVVIGQYIGVLTLVAVSLAAGLGLTFIPQRWIGVLGLIPLALGVRGFIRYFRALGLPKEISSSLNPGGLWGIVGITLANGGDNLAAYTPVFRSLSVGESIDTIVVFIVLIAAWLALARLIATRRNVLATISRIEGWLVPTVFCTLGALILFRFQLP
ncbi:cadmium resistance transporter [Leifsonia sp. P73]|uniref:cadmium resistance transporter n=1 Tax=Leifsonia sp. P73 TaxID=3423959 RepID=UPI003DA29FB9